MLIINVKDEGSIERALKTLKKKFDKTKTTKLLRERKEYKKPSEKRREEIKAARNKQEYLNCLIND